MRSERPYRGVNPIHCRFFASLHFNSSIKVFTLI